MASPNPGLLARFGSRLLTSISHVKTDTAPRLLAIAALVGLGAGLGAVVLIEAVDLVGSAASQLTGDDGATGWIFIILPSGLWLAWFVTYRLAPEAAGHGIPQIIASIIARSGRVRLRVAPLKTVATALTLGVGGSAGREGPIAHIGAAIGSRVGRRLRLNESQVRSLIGAGAAAGISATFNAPIAGMLFAMEVIVGSFSGAHMSAIVVASVVGAVVSRGIVGEGLTFSVQAYPLSSPWELILYALVGVAAAAAGYLFLKQLTFWETRSERLNQWFRPLIIGVGIAAIGYLRPEVLGTGQEFIEDLLRDEVSLASGLLLALVAMKAVASSATFGARGSGGIFMPSLFMGAALGSGLAALVSPVWTISTIQPGAFALVGMAAVFAAVARAPLSAILIVFEATGDYGLVLPLMLATLLAMTIGEKIHPESAYTMVLTRLGISSRSADTIDLLDNVLVGDVASPPTVVLSPDETLANAQGMLDRRRLHGAVVVEDDRLVGILTVADIWAAGGASDTVVVGDAMTRDPVAITPDVAVSQAMRRMSALGIGRLPVVSAIDGRNVIGMFMRENAVEAYHRAVDSATHDNLSHRRFKVTRGPDADFYELGIPRGSRVAGRTIREIPWPEGCLVVSLQRGADVRVARGDVVVFEGDVVTVFSGPQGRDRLTERLSPLESDETETEPGPP
jgi:CIC family chloride channel protein